MLFGDLSCNMNQERGKKKKIKRRKRNKATRKSCMVTWTPESRIRNRRLWTVCFCCCVSWSLNFWNTSSVWSFGVKFGITFCKLTLLASNLQQNLISINPSANISHLFDSVVSGVRVLSFLLYFYWGVYRVRWRKERRNLCPNSEWCKTLISLESSLFCR